MQLIVNEIAGEALENQLLLPPGVSPHHFSMKPSDARKLQSADIVFWIGPGFETPLTKTLSSHPGSVALGQAVATGADQHIWLDPLQVREMGRVIADALVEVDDTNAEKYRKNADNFDKNLEKLHNMLEALMQPLQRLRLAYHHDSYHHLESRYGLQEVAVLAPGHGSGSGVRSSVRLGNMLAQGLVDCVLTEPGQSNKLLKSLKVSERSQLVVVDPLFGGPQSQATSYFEFMIDLASALHGCLPD